MKITFVIFLATMFMSLSCKKEITEPTTSNVVSQKTAIVVEGTVLYSEAGGTEEIHYPSGFRLINCRWLTQYADSAHWPYLSGNIDSSYLNTNVRVFGVAETDTIYGMFNMRGWYTKVNVDSLIVLN